MTNKSEEPNTFAEMEKQNKTEQSDKPKPNELTLDDFSNTAVGDKVKYNRPNLDSKEDVIDKFQVFMPNINEEQPKDSQSGASKYWQPTIQITYESKNEDGVQNREYISGCKMFKQNDGTASEPQFWYDESRTQIAKLWELVAKTKGINPEDMSPREFVAFLNNKPKIKIKSVEYDNYGAPKGAPKTVNKNMVGEFL